MDSSSDSEDYVCIMKKCLDVELPPDFDPTKTPETGEEYVQYVMYERKHCKQWVVADNIDKSKFVKNQTFSVNVNEGCAKAPESMLPSKEWQESQLTDFLEFRKFINSAIVKIPVTEIVHLSHFSNKVKNEIPVFQELSKYSQGSKLKIFEMILEELDKLPPGEMFPYNMGVWIFGILSTLAIPLSPEACYSLRELARKCSLIRSNLPLNASYEQYTPLNSFICLVARYFNQLDLADPF